MPFAHTGGLKKRSEKFFIFFGRNSLKSPDSAKLNQIKPRKSKAFYLV
jgi:hypothetical protein